MKTQIEWIPVERELPPLEKGRERTYWCAVIHGYGKKLGYATLEYRNQYPACLSDDCYDVPKSAVPVSLYEDGYSEEYLWTGWFVNYTSEEWHEFDGKVLAWMELPRDWAHLPKHPAQLEGGG